MRSCLRVPTQGLFARFVLFAFVLWTTACTTVSVESLASAYVAPATLNLRRELTQKNGNVAVLRHGERVYILDVRRRFVRVRSTHGAEGWVDAAQLLTPEKMGAVQHATEAALRLPSEGRAGVYEALNVHIDPSRQSPSFLRIPEGGTVDVLAHKLQEKAIGPAKAPNFVVQRPQRARKPNRNKKEIPSNFPLPKTQPPKPPEGLKDLYAAAPPPVAPKSNQPTVLEDWTLVRTSDKQAGWVLTRNLVMSIPDEVAQYAEGRHITSYFSLGTVQDEEKGTKHHWLWTTTSEPTSADFDSWRVFIWNRKRHRFETSYRERDVEGYFPVTVDARAGAFQLITKEENGKLVRRAYFFDGVRVHLTGTEAYAATAEPSAAETAGFDTSKAVATPRNGWLHDTWQRLTRNFQDKK